MLQALFGDFPQHRLLAGSQHPAVKTSGRLGILVAVAIGVTQQQLQALAQGMAGVVGQFHQQGLAEAGHVVPLAPLVEAFNGLVALLQGFRRGGHWGGSGWSHSVR